MPANRRGLLVLLHEYEQKIGGRTNLLYRWQTLIGVSGVAGIILGEALLKWTGESWIAFAFLMAVLFLVFVIPVIVLTADRIHRLRRKRR